MRSRCRRRRPSWFCRNDFSTSSTPASYIGEPECPRVAPRCAHSSEALHARHGKPPRCGYHLGPPCCLALVRQMPRNRGVLTQKGPDRRLKFKRNCKMPRTKSGPSTQTDTNPYDPYCGIWPLISFSLTANRRKTLNFGAGAGGEAARRTANSCKELRRKTAHKENGQPSFEVLAVCLPIIGARERFRLTQRLHGRRGDVAGLSAPRRAKITRQLCEFRVA